MSKRIRFYNSTVGQKFIVGLTGLFLCSFLIVHFAGNMLLFVNDGGKAYNEFSEFMATNPAIRTLEIVLFAGFLIHIIWALSVWLHNRRSRPERYEVSRASESSTLSSRIGFLTGSIVLVFLVIHLKSFWVPTRFPSGAPISEYEMVKAAFAGPIYDGFYLIALVLLGYHLRQGFQSAFQTFGLRPFWRKPVELIAILFWLIIPVGFAAMPLYFLLWTR
ncbi:MAG TPA: succinate dehydrogenase cytochrome b subunit [Acidobacteriota bacterium]|nr:succinate dehydrogenase cytochrome b subunit [Acidobacteriota bacterium]